MPSIRSVIASFLKAVSEETAKGLAKRVWSARRIVLYFQIKAATPSADWKATKADILERSGLTDDEANWAKWLMAIKAASKLGHDFDFEGRKAHAPFAVTASHLLVTCVGHSHGNKFVQNPTPGHRDDAESIWHEDSQAKYAEILREWIEAGGEASWIRAKNVALKKPQSGTSQKAESAKAAKPDATSADVPDVVEFSEIEDPKARHMAGLDMLNELEAHLDNPTTTPQMAQLILGRLATLARKATAKLSEEDQADVAAAVESEELAF
jgi:hypothetical protein